MYSKVMALLNYNKYIQINYNKLFFSCCTWQSFCLQKQTIYCRICRALVINHTVQMVRIAAMASASGKQQNLCKGVVISQLSANDRNSSSILLKYYVCFIPENDTLFI